MMYQVIDALAAVLSATPAPLLPLSAVRAQEPSSAVDLPAVVLSLRVENRRVMGIGRFIREGHRLVETTTVREVRPENGFNSTLTAWYVMPLQLRKNPRSGRRGFTAEDVRLRRLNGSGVDYQLEKSPPTAQTFHYDPVSGFIRFGAPQTAGDVLELTYWSVQWRDDITPIRFEGALTAVVWGNTAEQTRTLARGCQRRLAGDRVALRRHGFVNLEPVALDALVQVRHTPAVGSDFAVWQQRIAYKFIYASESGGDASGGGPIREIDIDMEDGVTESFTISEAR